MKITTEKRLRLARVRQSRLEARIAELERQAAEEDKEEARIEVVRIKRERPPIKIAPLASDKQGMVGDVIEARFVRRFEGDLYIAMRVLEDRGESFTAECVRGTLPDGSTLAAFLKRMRNQTWR